MSALVGAAIRRELRESAVAGVEQHRHRVPIGLILLARDWITRAQLKQVLDLQQNSDSRPIGQLLVEACGVPQERIARALCTQWGCPVLTLEGFDAEAMSMAMPRLLLGATGIVPIRIARDRVLYVGSVDQPDFAAALALQGMSGLRVVVGLIDSAQYRAAQQQVSACEGVDMTLHGVSDVDTMARSITSAIVSAQPRASRLVRLQQFFWLRMWLESGAMSGLTGGFPRTREDVVDHVFALGPEQ